MRTRVTWNRWPGFLSPERVITWSVPRLQPGGHWTVKYITLQNDGGGEGHRRSLDPREMGPRQNKHHPHLWHEENSDHSQEAPVRWTCLFCASYQTKSPLHGTLNSDHGNMRVFNLKLIYIRIFKTHIKAKKRKKINLRTSHPLKKLKKKIK